MDHAEFVLFFRLAEQMSAGTVFANEMSVAF